MLRYPYLGAISNLIVITTLTNKENISSYVPSIQQLFINKPIKRNSTFNQTLLKYSSSVCQTIVKSLKKICLSSMAFSTIFSPVYALSSFTTESIKGNAPYLTLDDGVSKITSTEELLAIKLPNGTVITPQNDVSSITNPIELPDKKNTYGSVQTIVPLPISGNNQFPVINMTDLLAAPYNYFADDDGDGFDTNDLITATATGEIKIKWEARNPAVADINAKNAFIDITSKVKSHPDTIPDLCDGVHKITISASDSELTTPYGDPNTNHFQEGSHSYYLTPKLDPKVCYAQPNLFFDGGSLGGIDYQVDGILWDVAQVEDGSDYGDYRGYPSKGIKVLRATNSGNYQGETSITKNNFPTTGSHGLYFYLLFGGITPEAVLAANGSTVQSIEGGNVSLSLSVSKTTEWEHSGHGPEPYGLAEPAIKITLIGPRFNSTDKSFRPMTFRLYADSNKSTLIYEFKLMRWFIANPEIIFSNENENSSRPISSNDEALNYQAKARDYCKSLGSGYRLPDVNDFSNTNPGDGWIGGYVNRYGKYARRQLSYQENGKWIGGIANEWGCMAEDDLYDPGHNMLCQTYTGTDWQSYQYWTNNVTSQSEQSKNNGKPFIYVNEGYIDTIDMILGDGIFAACVTP
ncbi:MULTISPECIES: hypothetical protein [unclassified Gilliamella]|uniref:hypothetical protein n=1 Tax=unclassified Gilliamella TaxID=2685620 RepID=UPI000A3317CA|nr:MULTISPECIES: hypothetical protein [unclassified Gilliamella]OTQ73990.1 hypothetical protein B6C99_05875 [Gilliamella sp. N-G2]OTQ79368.1 hypothetical protein B6D23_05925 [Gilliamella sp. N-W3]